MRALASKGVSKLRLFESHGFFSIFFARCTISTSPDFKGGISASVKLKMKEVFSKYQNKDPEVRVKDSDIKSNSHLEVRFLFIQEEKLE